MALVMNLELKLVVAKVSTAKRKLVLLSKTNDEIQVSAVGLTYYCIKLMLLGKLTTAIDVNAIEDKKKVIITKASIRRDFRFEDEGGVDCLSNEVIFKHLTLMGKQRKEIEVPSPSSKIPNEEGVLTTSNDPIPSEAKTAQAKEIASLKKRVKKLEQKKKSRTSGLKRLRKVGLARRVESSTKASLGDQEDASKQERMIDNIDQDAEITLVDDTQGRINEEDMFGVNDLWYMFN
nr:hypothetical protein [Tanacetum cinerariifolium]